MRKIFVAITLSVFALTSSVFANDSTKVVLKNFEPESQHPVLYQLVGQILNSYHLRKLSKSFF
jgi:hypothetical protein